MMSENVASMLAEAIRLELRDLEKKAKRAKAKAKPNKGNEMSISSPMFPQSEELPRAYNGCTCSCHRHPGVLHCVPCCYPGKNNLVNMEIHEDGEVYWRKTKSDAEVGTEFNSKDGVDFDK